MRLLVALLAVTTAAYAAAPPSKCALDENTRNLFLNFHNEKRKELANGRIDGFPRAKNMYKLISMFASTANPTPTARRLEFLRTKLYAQHLKLSTRWSCDMERKAKKFIQFCDSKVNVSGAYGSQKMIYKLTGPIDSKRITEVIKNALATWWGPTKDRRLGPDNTYTGDRYLFSVANIINSATTQVACTYNVCPIKTNENQMEILCLYDDVAYVTGNYVYDTGKPCKNSDDCTTYRRSTCETATGLCVRPEEPIDDGTSLICPRGSGMTDKIRNTFLDLHNDFRSLVASGKAEDKLVNDGKGFAPEAANMRKMVYDCKLEEMATKYARGCVYKHSTNESRKLPEEKDTAGENLYTVSIPDADYIKAAEWGTRGWFRELKEFGVGRENYLTETLWNRRNNNPKVKIGHYTQMVWGDTDRIGCGIQHCYENKGEQRMQTLVVCNYLIGGNFINRKIYEIGKPCSQCPEGYECEGNLCAKKSRS